MRIAQPTMTNGTSRGEGMLAHRLRASLARGVVATGAAALGRSRQKCALRILMYHGVLPRLEGPAAYGNLFMTTEAFGRQMAHLKQAFHVMALDDAIRVLATGAEFPDRAVAITFDDGYRTTLTEALPILRRLRLPATVFLPAALVGAEGFLWFDALRAFLAEHVGQGRAVDLGDGPAGEEHRPSAAGSAFAERLRMILGLPRADHRRVVERLVSWGRQASFCERYPEFALAGWEEWRDALTDGLLAVGAHGLSHENLLAMTPDERLDSLRQSKDRIEQVLSRPCPAFAYPYGAWDGRVADAVQQAGFACGLTTDEGLNRSTTHRFTLHRTMVGDQGDFYLFSARVSGVWSWFRRGVAQRRTVPLAPVRVSNQAVA